MSAWRLSLNDADPDAEHAEAVAAVRREHVRVVSLRLQTASRWRRLRLGASRPPPGPCRGRGGGHGGRGRRGRRRRGRASGSAGTSGGATSPATIVADRRRRRLQLFGGRRLAQARSGYDSASLPDPGAALAGRRVRRRGVRSLRRQARHRAEAVIPLSAIGPCASRTPRPTSTPNRNTTTAATVAAMNDEDELLVAQVHAAGLVVGHGSMRLERVVTVCSGCPESDRSAAGR